MLICSTSWITARAFQGFQRIARPCPGNLHIEQDYIHQRNVDEELVTASPDKLAASVNWTAEGKVTEVQCSTGGIRAH